MSQNEVTQSPEERILAMLDAQDPEPNEVEANPDNAKVEGEETEPAQPETEAESVEIDPDAKFIEVEVVVEGGEKKTEKLSLNELKSQRMMQADYQRKTQELARQRDEVPEKIRQGIQEQLTKSVQQIQSFQEVLLATVAPELKGTDWNKLANEDPAEYVRRSNRAREIEQAYQQMEAAKQQQLSQLGEMNKQQLQKLREESKGKIKSKIPNYDEIEPTLKETAIKQYGFTQEQLDSIAHPGFAELLHDAHEFQKTKSATKTIVEKKVLNVPKVLKPGTPKEDGKSERMKENMNRLKKTGRTEDAAAAIFQMLK